MKDLLLRSDKNTLNLLTKIGRLARDLGFHAYLVGGPVRDLVLKKPNLDLDITLEGKALVLAEAFAGLHKGSSIIRYPAFGTATVALAQGLAVDFATARSEVYPYKGSFPKVKPSNLIEDLFRRDFTINAMALALDPDQYGLLVDPLGGMADLKARCLRIMHEASFTDDPTRILRAARFKARLCGRMDSRTLVFLKEAVAAGALNTISVKRYCKEIEKISKEATADKAIAVLRSWKAYRPC